MTRDEFYRLVSRDRLLDAIEAHGTPGYVFFEDVVAGQVKKLQSTFEGYRLSFSVKSNPNPEVLSMMLRFGLGADVSSGGELKRVLEVGFDPRHVQFSGPGKSPEELTYAAAQGIDSINVESLEELAEVAAIGAARGRVRIGLRINPLLPNAKPGIQMTGKTAFGILEEDVGKALAFIREHSDALDLRTLHAHVGSQVLEAEQVLSNQAHMLRLAARIEVEHGSPLETLNFGGGLGVKYFPYQPTLDLDTLRAGVAEMLSKREGLPKTMPKLMVEPGRFLVAESGVYITSIRYRKSVRGEQYAVVDGGFHQCYVLAGGMGQLLRRNFEVDVLAARDHEEVEREAVLQVAGCNCTPQDTLARNLEVPFQPRPGDYVCFFNCGSYGLTASPAGFISHGPCHETVIRME